MYVEALILGFLIGKFRNGRIENFSNIYIKGFVFIILAICVQLSPIILNKFGVLKEYYYLFPFISSVLMLMVVLINIKYTGMKLIFLGAILNIISMIQNNFYMPISFNSLKLIGKTSFISFLNSSSIIGFIDADKLSGIKFLMSKFIPTIFYPFPRVLSFGDILITIGIVFFVQYSMKKSDFSVNHRTLNFTFKDF